MLSLFNKKAKNDKILLEQILKFMVANNALLQIFILLKFLTLLKKTNFI